MRRGDPGTSTDERVVEQVVEALTRLGKAAVVVGDGPGFVANRIQFAMFREAARIVEDGVATAEQVDEVVRSSFGFRLPFFGPFTIADMAGLDVYADIFETLERGLGAGFAAPQVLREHVDRGEFGVKTGRGFLELSPAEARRADRPARPRLRALAQLRREVEPDATCRRRCFPSQRLDGRHAIVTGAGRGIGRAAALALAEAGADVTLFARSEASSKRSPPRCASAAGAPRRASATCARRTTSSGSSRRPPPTTASRSASRRRD